MNYEMRKCELEDLSDDGLAEDAIELELNPNDYLNNDGKLDRSGLIDEILALEVDFKSSREDNEAMQDHFDFMKRNPPASN